MHDQHVARLGRGMVMLEKYSPKSYFFDQVYTISILVLQCLLDQCVTNPIMLTPVQYLVEGNSKFPVASRKMFASKRRGRVDGASM